MFTALGKLVTRHWVLVLAGWAAILTGAIYLVPRDNRVGSSDDDGFLPAWVPSQRAAEMIQAHFDRPPTMSVAAIVVERPGGLTGSAPTAPSAGSRPGSQPARADSDWAYLARLTEAIKGKAGRSNWRVLSPADPGQAFLRGVLVSADAQAAVVKVDLPRGFASREAILAVDWLAAAVTEAQAPPGLAVAVTGSASYGRDSTYAAEISLQRTTWVAAIVVIAILLATYRALPVVGVSILTVAVAVIVAVSIVAIGASYGWSVSVIVELFTIIVGFGAGVDFSLFFLSRYREELGEGGQLLSRAGRRAALVRVTARTGPAILASAGTVAAGLGLMWFAKFPVFHSAGPSISISVILACLASLTLTPALACLAGGWIFWPRRLVRLPDGTDAGGGPWNRIAAFTVRRPGLLLAGGLAVLVPLAAIGWRQEVVYDTLADLPGTDSSVRGAAMFRRHFPIGEIAPVQIVVQPGRPLSEADWAATALAVDRRLAGHPAVRGVRSFAHPLGLHGPEISPQEVAVLTTPGSGAAIGQVLLLPGLAGPLGIPTAALAQRMRGRIQQAADVFRRDILPRYLARDRGAGLWEVALAWPPYVNESLDSLDTLAETVSEALGQTPGGEPGTAPGKTPATAPASPRVALAGDTALMRDLREVTNADFLLVGLLAVGTIILIVTVLIRDVGVALFVMGATILTYGAALGLTSWTFHLLFGIAGPDWKVEFFLFVILVAVGQDYNLFMLTRIMEERRNQLLRPAVQAAIARTGSIISYCGLIMAATLGSLATSPMKLMQELGVAFILGLLLDTFLVRPLMVPAFILVFRRMKPRRPWPPAPR